MVAFQIFKLSYMHWGPWRANSGKCVCTKNLGIQPPLKGCDSQLSALIYCTESWEEGHERSPDSIKLTLLLANKEASSI